MEEDKAESKEMESKEENSSIDVNLIKENTLENEQLFNNSESYPYSGVESIQGRRPTMEDTHVMLDDIASEFPNLVSKENFSFYGVYDGHGGAQAALLCQELLIKNIINDPAFAAGDFELAFKHGFQETDKNILAAAISKDSGFTSGCTAIAILVDRLRGVCIVANVGDSEAVLGRWTGTTPTGPGPGSDLSTSDGDCEAILLSKKHKPNDPEERDRIRKAGGHVVFGRIMGSLAVARSLGDREYKYPYNKGDADFVSSEPFIQTYNFTPMDEFLIISCDGLWDKMSYQYAVNFVNRYRELEKSPSETVKFLVQDALERGSLDNITTIVVFFPRNDRSPKNEQRQPTECVSSNSIRSLSDSSNGNSNKESNLGNGSSDSDSNGGSIIINANDSNEIVGSGSSNANKKANTNTNTNTNDLSDVKDPDEVVSPYEFLREYLNDGSAVKETCLTKRDFSKLKLFKLPDTESLLYRFPCLFSRKLMDWQGLLLVTENFVCLFARKLGKKIMKKFLIQEIVSIDKCGSDMEVPILRLHFRPGMKWDLKWEKNDIQTRDNAHKRLVEQYRNVTNKNSTAPSPGNAEEAIPTSTIAESPSKQSASNEENNVNSTSKSSRNLKSCIAENTIVANDIAVVKKASSDDTFTLKNSVASARVGLEKGYSTISKKTTSETAVMDKGAEEEVKESGSEQMTEENKWSRFND